MTTKKADAKKVVTPEFRVSFPAVFKPRAAVEGQEPKYSMSMVFPKTTDITALKQLAANAVMEKWGADKTKWPKNLRSPFRDGSEKDYDGYGPDVVFVSATSKVRPGLVGPDLQPIISENEFYGGCYARAEVTAFAYDVSGNKGIAFGLRNIQKTRDGEPFSGNSKPEEVFDAVKPAAATAGAAAGAADEGGLFG